MTERAPLLVPPNAQEPSACPAAPPSPRADWPADTDKERKRLAALRKAEEDKKEAAADPNNPYAGKPKLLDKMLGKNKTAEEGETVDVPEPDPSDKTAGGQGARALPRQPRPHKPVDQTLNAPATPAGSVPSERARQLQGHVEPRRQQRQLVTRKRCRRLRPLRIGLKNRGPSLKCGAIPPDKPLPLRFEG